MVEKSYLLDVFTKLYIATDSNPVDGHTYELCSDLVDVVIDVSCIYGLSPQDGAAIPYDHESSSAIHLNSGMVLYLREVRKAIFVCRRYVQLCLPSDSCGAIAHFASSVSNR